MENITFEAFKEDLIKELEGKFPEGTKMEFKNILKNNDVDFNTLIIMEPGQNVSPTIYLDPIYEDLCKGLSMEEIAESIQYLWKRHRKGLDFDPKTLQDFVQVMDRIVFRLVNYEKNRKLLEDCPHTRFLDLAVCFQYILPGEATGEHDAFLPITNGLAQRYGTDAEELFQYAFHNTRRLMGQKLQDMNTLLPEILGPQAQLPEEEQGIGDGLYILTNREKCYGASALLYTDRLKAFADSQEADLYILPSSVHEVILLPISQLVWRDRKTAKTWLTELVQELNRTELDPMEVLSDNIYYFDRAKNELRIA